jgi:hypothetical protein
VAYYKLYVGETKYVDVISVDRLPRRLAKRFISLMEKILHLLKIDIDCLTPAFEREQGDQIGRIFACWAIIYFRHCFENYTISSNFWATFSTVKVL